MQKLTKKIIELIHGLPFEEACMKEKYWEWHDCKGKPINRLIEHKPITIGRVIMALKRCKTMYADFLFSGYSIIKLNIWDSEIKGTADITNICKWETIINKANPDIEATLEDQSDKTKSKLWELVKDIKV